MSFIDLLFTGLYSLAKRVDALNGAYGVKARKDNATGSRFWFSIPYFPDVILEDCPPSRPDSAHGQVEEILSTGRETSAGESTIMRDREMMLLSSAENSERSLPRNDSISGSRSHGSAPPLQPPLPPQPL